MKRLSCSDGSLFVAVLSAAPALPPQGAAALSTFLKGATDRGDVPGRRRRRRQQGRHALHEAFGLSSTLRNTPMAKDTIFNMASMTKPVTSVAIMMLVDEGKLKLDDDVAKYLPKYKDPLVISKFNDADASYETRPAKRPITIRHLLTHTSGIGYGFASPMLTKIMQKTGKTELDLPLLFDPGESWAYGASTRVLGNVVEAISGQKIDAFLESRILRPLGMNDTSYLVPTGEVSARRRGERARRRRQVRGAADAGHAARHRARRRRPVRHRQRLRPVPAHAAQPRHAGEDAHPERGVGEDDASRTTRATWWCSRRSRRIWRCRGTSRWAPARTAGGSASSSPPRSSRTGARPGSGTWAGIFNTHFFIDPAREIGVVVMMQTLPFYDEASMKVYADVEEAVYRNLK